VKEFAWDRMSGDTSNPTLRPIIICASGERLLAQEYGLCTWDRSSPAQHSVFGAIIHHPTS